MKKTAAKKSPAKKTAAKKTAAKKTATKKTATKKTAAKKTAAKKTAAKKTAAKKTAAKKTTTKKTAKKAPAKKTAKTAAKPSPARQAASAPVEAPNLGARIAPGDRLLVELGDNDAIDRYTFTVTRFDDDGLAVTWQMEGAGDHGEIVYTRRALDDAARLSLMSQGSTLYADASDSDERVDGSMPPFLVSRAFLRALHDGEASCVMPAINQEHTFKLEGRGAQTIVFGGAELSVPTLTAVGDDVELVIVDDPSFPLVLRRAEWGDDNVLFHEHR